MRFWPDEYQWEKILLWVSVSTVLAFLLSLCAFAYFAEVFTQLLSMLLGLILLLIGLISFIAAVTRWSMICWIAFVCFILAFPSCSQATKLGHWARIRVFEHRLPEYEKVVKEVTKEFDGKARRYDPKDMPDEWRKLGYWIYVFKDDRNSAVVNFIWGIDFPVKHTAFVWRADGALPTTGDFRKEWPHCTRINDNWFRCGD